MHPFRYQGQYEDEETGLYYNRFRCYLSDTIVFLDCITMSCILR
ncbi:RHS repeat-associated core domain-containing protein [Tenacibaculum sp. IMCC1]|nr:RHS repeat-associated core domain-containing protein [Tenacibaculum mesophilum]